MRSITAAVLSLTAITAAAGADSNTPAAPTEATPLATGVYAMAWGDGPGTEVKIRGKAGHVRIPPLVPASEMRSGEAMPPSPLGYTVAVDVTSPARRAINDARKQAGGGEILLYVVLSGSLRGPYALGSDVGETDPLIVMFPRVDAQQAERDLAAFTAAQSASAKSSAKP